MFPDNFKGLLSLLVKLFFLEQSLTFSEELGGLEWCLCAVLFGDCVFEVFLVNWLPF